MPVRKTLDIGNRHVQKAYVEKVVSPNKDAASNHQQHLNVFNPYGSPEKVIHSDFNANMNFLAGAAPADVIATTEEDKKNKKQEEHRRALQAQIELKKKQKEDELLKEKLEDEKLLRVRFFSQLFACF